MAAVGWSSVRSVAGVLTPVSVDVSQGLALAGSPRQGLLADVSAASERREYDRAGASYGALTTACIDSHKHVAKSRIADAPR
jgi:hypothetical protein